MNRFCGRCICVLCSDLVDVFCAVLSLVVAILIGVWQFRQDVRVNKLTVEQNRVNELRYRDSVEVEAREFLFKYHECICLLPLCAIAFCYNSMRVYSRKMYADFCLLSRDVRLKVFEYKGWRMCDVNSDRFFLDCLDELEKVVNERLVKDDFGHMFYDNGKYVERALICYGENLLPHPEFEYQDKLSDIVIKPFRDNVYDNGVIDVVMNDFNFGRCSEIEACQIACLTAKYVAMFSQDICFFLDDDYVDYGCPGVLDDNGVSTMEDLFLLTLFEIWSNLMDK